MLLLDTTSLQLCQFASDAPPYATFSSTIKDVVLDDPCSPQTTCQRPGFQALRRACLVCQRHGLQWLWNDAVCINRASSAALSESLNSLAEIYRKGRLCIVYLHDLLDTQASDVDMERGLSSCSWFEHVWMFPHLVFSTVLQFYDAQWNHIGSKSELTPQLSRITSIDERVLQDSDSLEDYPNCVKMTWAARLSADRVEDAAYSLLAIFNVSMPINYGEGTTSFLRLQEEILKNTNDYSLLAWQPRTSQQYRGILAHSPLEYIHFKNKSAESPKLYGELKIQSDGIQVQAGLGGRENDLLLPLHTCDGPATWIVLSLWDGIFVRNCIKTVVDGSEVSNVFIRNICVRRDVDPGLSGRIARHRIVSSEKQYGPCHSPNDLKDYLLTRFPRISTSGDSRETRGTSICDRVIRPAICSPKTGSIDVVNYDAGHAPAKDAQEGILSLSLLGRRTNYFRKQDDCLTDLSLSTRSRSCETADGKSPKGAPDSHPETPLTLEPGHPFSFVTGDLKTILVDRFLSTCNSRPKKRALLSWPQRACERPRVAWSDPYMDVELASDSKDIETVVVHHAVARASIFACPFYLMDKKRHEKCLTRHNLSTIDEVKEHLWASHRRPNFCPICKETFATIKARDEHIRRRGCQRRESPIFDGLTDGQIQQLARQGSPPLSRESQWYGLWDVVFPSSPSGPRPISPYYSTEQEFRVVALRSFWEVNGRTIISDFLREKDLQGWGISDEERSLAILFKVILHGAIDEVYRRFSGGTTDLPGE